MDALVKKTVLRMIPYGLYVLTVTGTEGVVSAATVNWVTQASFNPPLIALGIKADSQAHALVKERQQFVLNVLGQGQAAVAFTFFKPVVLETDAISGQPYRLGNNGAPILTNAPAYIECKLLTSVEGIGDHSVFIAEVIEAGLNATIEGRPDDAILKLKDLGEKIFYGG
jgi:flavin reductase (DIM6/NTAB) family NADH-FMN oxidoreductase RutF